MTYTSLVNGLSSMTVTGVVCKYSESPPQLSSAQLPAMYPRLPEGSLAVLNLSGVTGLLECVVELVIVVNSTMQSTSGSNFVLCLSLLDALNTALASNVIALNLDRWSLRQEEGIIGDIPYWLIVARVEASS